MLIPIYASKTVFASALNSSVFFSKVLLRADAVMFWKCKLELTPLQSFLQYVGMN